MNYNPKQFDMQDMTTWKEPMFYYKTAICLQNVKWTRWGDRLKLAPLWRAQIILF